MFSTSSWNNSAVSVGRPFDVTSIIYTDIQNPTPCHHITHPKLRRNPTEKKRYKLTDDDVTYDGSPSQAINSADLWSQRSYEKNDAGQQYKIPKFAVKQ